MMLPRRSLAQTAEFIIERFSAYGVAVHPSSRWGQWRRSIFGDSGAPLEIPVNSPDFDIVLEAHRDFAYQSFVFDVVPDPPPSGFIERLRFLGKDPVFSKDAKSSKGRDAQTELFVAAVCWNAGLFPVEFAEPDVCCTFEGSGFTLAVKRLKSIARLEDRVREGADQIYRSGHRGAIILDTTQALNPKNHRIWRNYPNGEFERRYGQIFNSEIGAHEDMLRRRARDKGVRGMIFHDTQLRLAGKQQWDTESMNLFFPASRHPTKAADFNRFSTAYKVGLPNSFDLD